MVAFYLEIQYNEGFEIVYFLIIILKFKELVDLCSLYLVLFLGKGLYSILPIQFEYHDLQG